MSKKIEEAIKDRTGETVEIKAYSFEDNLPKYVEMIGYFRWYPDLFLDLLKPKTGGINLHLDQRVFLRSMVRFQSMYGIASRSFGKCIAGNSIIYSNQGMIKIGDLFNNQNDDVETTKNIDLDVINRFGKQTQSSTGIYSGTKPTKIIKTKNGYDIEGTLVHPLLTMNGSGNLEYKMLSEIQVGDYICINRANDIWGTDLTIDYKLQIDEWFYKRSKQSKSHIKERVLPTQMTEDIALWLGYIVGDGGMTTPNRISFTNENPDILYNFKRITKDTFGVDYIRQCNRIDYAVCDMYLKQYLNILGLSNAGGHDKSVPEIIMRSPKNIVASFLRGLFDTDGGIEYYKIGYTTVSETLSKQVQIMLLNFGIISKRDLKIDNKGFMSYRLCITGVNIRLFFENIGFGCSYKQDGLIKMVRPSYGTNTDSVPHQGKLLRIFKKELIAMIGWRNMKSIFSYCVSDKGMLTHERLNDILNQFGDYDSELYRYFSHLQDLHYYYTPVTAIFDGSADVYDINVPESNSFIANGIVNHNTLLEVLGMVVAAVLYPNCNQSLTAQTKQNASKLLRDKWKEIERFYPLLKNELAELPKFSKDEAQLVFRNGSVIDILANAQTSKGSRRHKINIEESALMDASLFDDALLPIVDNPRRTAGEYSIINPQEMHRQVHFFSTSWYRASYEYTRFVQMINEMIECKGSFVFTSGWQLGAWYGRGADKTTVRKQRDKINPVMFDMNYCSKWVGVTEGALVDIQKLIGLRTLTEYSGSNTDGGEYYMGVDVARAEEGANNAQTSIMIARVLRHDNHSIKRIQIPYMVTISGTKMMSYQAHKIKEYFHLFKCQALIIDSNGLGKGLCDELLKDDDEFGQMSTMNSDIDGQSIDAPKVVYDLKVTGSTSANSDIIVTFMGLVSNEKLELLVSKETANVTVADIEMSAQDRIPYLQTDFLIQEISNLQLVTLSNSRIGVKSVIPRLGKDRYSSLIYVLWYIMTFERGNGIKDDGGESLLGFAGFW